MENSEELFVQRVCRIVDVVGSAAPVTVEPVPSRPWRSRHGSTGRWAAALVLTAGIGGGAWLLAIRDRPPSGSFEPVASVSTTTAEHGIIAEWRTRMSDRTASYRMDLGCECVGMGEWEVVERDGVVVEAWFLGAGEPGAQRPAILLSQALDLARDADGPVVVSELAPGAIRLTVDSSVDVIDDEFGITIADFILVPDPESQPSLSFTPVGLREIPTGYRLLSARFELGADGQTYGAVRYEGPPGEPDLMLVIRPWSDGAQRMMEAGRDSWRERGRTVVSDGEGDGSCMPDVCSVGMQWDPRTYVSVMWLSRDGEQLASVHTIDSLVELATRVTAVDVPVYLPGSITDR